MEFDVFILTFNMGGMKQPYNDMTNFIPNPEKYHLIVLGFQECKMG